MVITLRRRPGTTVVSATSTFNVNGQSITRDDRHRRSTRRPAVAATRRKTWVDANVSITPATATNAVGTNHTLTISVAPVERDDRLRHLHRDGIARRGQRRLVRRLEHLHLHAARADLHGRHHLDRSGHERRERDDDRERRRPVDHPHDRHGGQHERRRERRTQRRRGSTASISITPGTATNAVGTNHTLTISVAPVVGTLDAGTYTATASIVSGPGSFSGSPTCTYSNVDAEAAPSSSPRPRRARPSSRRRSTFSVERPVDHPHDGHRREHHRWRQRQRDARRGSTRTSRSRRRRRRTRSNTNHTLTISVAGVNGTIDAGTYTATASIVSGPRLVRRRATRAPTRPRRRPAPS